MKIALQLFKVSRSRRFSVIVLSLMCLTIYACPARAASSVADLKLLTAKIAVAHSSGTDAGSGVLLCQNEDRVYIATAKHVLIGEGAIDDETNRPTERFRGSQSLEVAFFGGAIVKGPVENFQIKYAETKDLALLVVRQTNARVGNIAVGSADDLAEGQDVVAIGQSTASGSDFLAVFGKISAAREFILFSPAVERGFSGGPLFVTDGSLVGINVQKAGSLTKTVPVDEFLRVFRNDLPSGCLGPVRRSTEKQHFSKNYLFKGPFLVGREEGRGVLSFFVTPPVVERSLGGKNLLVSAVRFKGDVAEESSDPFGFDTEVIISNRPIDAEGKSFSGVEWAVFSDVDSRALPNKMLHVVSRTNMSNRVVGSGAPLQWSFNFADDIGSLGLEHRFSKNDPFIVLDKGLYVQLFCWTYWGGSHSLVFSSIELMVDYQEY